MKDIVSSVRICCTGTHKKRSINVAESTAFNFLTNSAQTGMCIHACAHIQKTSPSYWARWLQEQDLKKKLGKHLDKTCYASKQGFHACP